MARAINGIPTAVKNSAVVVTAKNLAGTSAAVKFQLGIIAFPPGLIGSYAGMVGHEYGVSSAYRGQVALAVTSTGAATGSLTLGGVAYRFTGSVAVEPGADSGILTFTLLKNKTPWLTCAMTLQTDATLHAGGITLAAEADPVATIALVRNHWTKALPTPEAGLLNLSLTPSGDILTDAAYPHGTGFLNITVAALGTAKWTGRLADGTTLTGAGLIGKGGHIPVCQALYANTGTITALPQSSAGIASGELNWIKAQQAAKVVTRSYKAGFALHSVAIAGGRYTLPAKGVPLMTGLADTVSNAEIVFAADGGLTNELAQWLTISAKNAVTFPATVPNLNLVKLTLAPATGLFNGTFTLSDPNPAKPAAPLKRTVEYRGCLIPGNNHGAGYFLVPELSSAGLLSTTSPINSGALTLHPVK